MQVSQAPTKIDVYWGKNAGSPYIRTVPDASQIGINPGFASWSDGFVPLNATPVASGGIPPFMQDTNGALRQISQWSQWQAAGGPVTYDGTFQTAIGGYPKGAVIQSGTTTGLFWLSTADNNTTNPDTGGAGWVVNGWPGVQAALASTTTTDLGTAGSFNVRITGNTTVAGFGTTANLQQPLYLISFASALTITNSVSMICPGGLDISTNAEDRALVQEITSGVWRIVAYWRANGQPLINIPSAGTISGGIPSSITGTTATISAFSGADSTGAVTIALPTGASWAVSNGANVNGVRGGSLSNGTTYHLHAISGPGKVSGVWADTSATAPSLPSGYVYFRRIWSFLTAASGNQVHAAYQGASASEWAGGSLYFPIIAQLDLNAASISTSRSLITLSVPAGIKVAPEFRATSASTTGNVVAISSPDEPDAAPTYASGAFSSAPGFDLNDTGITGTTGQIHAFGYNFKLTNTSGQLAYRSNGSATIYQVTTGFIDPRRN